MGRGFAGTLFCWNWLGFSMHSLPIIATCSQENMRSDSLLIFFFGLSVKMFLSTSWVSSPLMDPLKALPSHQASVYKCLQFKEIELKQLVLFENKKK